MHLFRSEISNLTTYVDIESRTVGALVPQTTPRNQSRRAIITTFPKEMER